MHRHHHSKSEPSEDPRHAHHAHHHRGPFDQHRPGGPRPEASEAGGEHFIHHHPGPHFRGFGPGWGRRARHHGPFRRGWGHDFGPYPGAHHRPHAHHWGPPWARFWSGPWTGPWAGPWSGFGPGRGRGGFGPGWRHRGPGHGWGHGRSPGHGGHEQSGPDARQAEIAHLEEVQRQLEQSLAQVRQRLEHLRGNPSSATSTAWPDPSQPTGFNPSGSAEVDPSML